MTSVPFTGISADSLGRRQRVILVWSVAAITAVAWLVLAAWSAPVAPGTALVLSPHTGVFGPGAFFLTTSMWFVMMVAMMLPSVLPWILIFGSAAQGGDRRGSPYVPASVFAGGYFSVWFVFSLGAAVLQLGLHNLALIGLDLTLSTFLGGVILVAAGIFQVTPLKRVCLAHCRNPLSFLLSNWRDGTAGAFRMGFGHGIYCLGCCWALMLLSFALGVMNLLWMAALTVVIATEKLAPRGELSSRAFGLVFTGWGLWLVLGPGA